MSGERSFKSEATPLPPRSETMPAARVVRVLCKLCKRPMDWGGEARRSRTPMHLACWNEAERMPAWWCEQKWARRRRYDADAVFDRGERPPVFKQPVVRHIEVRKRRRRYETPRVTCFGSAPAGGMAAIIELLECRRAAAHLNTWQDRFGHQLALGADVQTAMKTRAECQKVCSGPDIARRDLVRVRGDGHRVCVPAKVAGDGVLDGTDSPRSAYGDVDEQRAAIVDAITKRKGRRARIHHCMARDPGAPYIVCCSLSCKTCRLAESHGAKTRTDARWDHDGPNHDGTEQRWTFAAQPGENRFYEKLPPMLNKAPLRAKQVDPRPPAGFDVSATNPRGQLIHKSMYIAVHTIDPSKPAGEQWSTVKTTPQPMTTAPKQRRSRSRRWFITVFETLLWEDAVRRENVRRAGPDEPIVGGPFHGVNGLMTEAPTNIQILEVGRRRYEGVDAVDPLPAHVTAVEVGKARERVVLGSGGSHVGKQTAKAVAEFLWLGPLKKIDIDT